MAGHTAAAGMDRMYRNQRRIYDLSRAYYLLGRDELIQGLDALPGTTVLEIACGTARNLIKVAERYPGARLYGFDVSSEMLTTAGTSIKKRRLEKRITLGLGDATTFSSEAMFDISNVDRIFVSYAVSMIPQWEDVINTAIMQLAPGGSLHIVDFGTMDRMPHAARRALSAWLAAFEVTPRRTLGAACEIAAARHGMSCSFHESPRGYWALARISRRASLR